MRKRKVSEAADRPAAIAAPDWTDHGTTTGGKGWKPEMVRRYPAPESTGVKRGVRVDFLSWVGYAPGASHTRVGFSVDRNYVWSGERWQAFYDDPEWDGHHRLEEGNSFVDQDRALRYAARTLEQRFPVSEGWEHSWSMFEDDDGNEVRGKWDPARVPPDEALDAQVRDCPVCGAAVGEHSARETAQCADIAGDIATVKLSLPPAGSRVREIVSPRFLVDCGRVVGTVGESVLVLADMQPKHVALLDSGVRALIVERGGATAHLAQVARELGVTVALVPDAVELYPEGVVVVVDPDSGVVEGGGAR